MNAPLLVDYIAELEGKAHSAGVAEEDLRREFTRRLAELESERQFAFRRYNLMQAVIRAVATVADEKEAVATGRAAFLRELGWADTTEFQRRVTDRFKTVVVAVWSATQSAEANAAAIGVVKTALAEFETWYAESNGAAFLTLMEPSLEYFPLVEG